MPRSMPSALTTSDIPRNRGIHVVSGPGAGKSTFLGKLIAYPDFMTGKPLLIIDPQGGTIDNFLYKVMCLPPDAFREVRDKIIYIDMSGKDTGYVGQFPLWYRLPGDGLWDVAQRFVRAVDRLDPDLRRAPVTGYNPFSITASHVGIILYSLGLPLTEAPDLLARPKAWADRLRQLSTQDPEVVQSVHWFLNTYTKEPVYEQKKDTSTFLNKIDPLIQDRVKELMFCSTEPTIDWADVIKNKKAVLLDFRYEKEPDFKILWALTGFLEHIQMRGMVRDQPVSVIIDELQYLLKMRAEMLANDFDDLINRIARNSDLWLTLAHQDMFQVSDLMKDTLMSMGTQVIGYTTKQQTALDYAARFTDYDEYKVKDKRPIYRNEGSMSYLINETPVYFTAQEQLIKRSEEFRKLLRFEFMVAVSRGEGSSWGPIKKWEVPATEAGFDSQAVKKAKDGLARRSGIPFTPRTFPVSQPVFEEVRPPAPPVQEFVYEEVPIPPKKQKVAEKAPELNNLPPKPRARSGRKK